MALNCWIQVNFFAIMHTNRFDCMRSIFYIIPCRLFFDSGTFFGFYVALMNIITCDIVFYSIFSVSIAFYIILSLSVFAFCSDFEQTISTVSKPIENCPKSLQNKKMLEEKKQMRDFLIEAIAIHVEMLK